MKKEQPFAEKIIGKLREQIKGKRTGFLLGSGASFLDGRGYPLTTDLWLSIKEFVLPNDRDQIETKLQSGCENLERALDALDNNARSDFPLRHRVSCAINKCFGNLTPPLDVHRRFVVGLSARTERRVPVFTLNYDPLVELAGDLECQLVIDGFCGTLNSYFKHACFYDYHALPECRRGRTVAVTVRGTINLYKLHGSMGWYLDCDNIARRVSPGTPVPEKWIPLLIPPQNRKTSDTGYAPYAALWSEFRGVLANDSTRLLSRLICVGYGMGDGHVNAVIQSALARPHFTLVIMARNLSEETFRQWVQYRNAIIATESRSSLFGEQGPGICDGWSFEWLAKEVGSHG